MIIDRLDLYITVPLWITEDGNFKESELLDWKNLISVDQRVINTLKSMTKYEKNF